MTDLPPLLSADAGILIGKNDLVRRVSAVAGARPRAAPAGGGMRSCLCRQWRVRAARGLLAGGVRTAAAGANRGGRQMEHSVAIPLALPN